MRYEGKDFHPENPVYLRVFFNSIKVEGFLPDGTKVPMWLNGEHMLAFQANANREIIGPWKLPLPEKPNES